MDLQMNTEETGGAVENSKTVHVGVNSKSSGSRSNKNNDLITIGKEHDKSQTNLSGWFDHVTEGMHNRGRSATRLNNHN